MVVIAIHKMNIDMKPTYRLDAPNLNWSISPKPYCNAIFPIIKAIKLIIRILFFPLNSVFSFSLYFSITFINCLNV